MDINQQATAVDASNCMLTGGILPLGFDVFK